MLLELIFLQNKGPSSNASVRYRWTSPAIHDIRLRFTFNHLWTILSTSSPSSPLIKNIDSRFNKDITLQDIDLGNHVVKTTVHNTNTVSVIVACTVNPIPIDMFGLVKLSSSLARVEDRLQYS